MIPLSGAPLGLPHAVISALSGGFGSIAALAAAFLHPARAARAVPPSLGLLRKSALHAPPPDLPDARTRLAMLSVALRSSTPEDVSAPPSRKTAMVRILRRMMEKAGRHNLSDLTESDTTELVLLKRLINAAPAKAGALAQLFEQPNTVLDLRDEYRALGARRDTYDRDKAALKATEALWRSGQHIFGNMMQANLAMGTADTDLWHHIVRSDPLSTQAFWCVTQPECDRATVAVFMAHVARSGALLRAITMHDKNRIDLLRAIIKRWTAGGYMISGIALTRSELGEDPARLLSIMLDRAAQRLNEPRWPEPCGLFTPFDGRPARDRSHWDIKNARLMRAPDSAAYLEMHLI